MPRLYTYIGPAHLAKHANGNTPRVKIARAADAVAWVTAQDPVDTTATATFVVLPDGLWLADRHSEHIACARGAAVCSAGEMTLTADLRRGTVEVVYVTNQSTGYCPEAASWPAVDAALDDAGIAHPDGFSVELAFRRCPACSAINIVKDDWFECAVCAADLPRDWNCDAASLTPPSTPCAPASGPLNRSSGK